MVLVHFGCPPETRGHDVSWVASFPNVFIGNPQAEEIGKFKMRHYGYDGFVDKRANHSYIDAPKGR